MDVVHLLGPLIKGLEIAVPQRPSWRDPIEMDELLKILLTQPEVRSSVHFCGTTNEIVTAGLKRLVVFIKPSVLGDIAPLLEDFFRIPILGLLRQPVPPL
jgi:hypothetical protein